MIGGSFGRLLDRAHERWRDPILTVLTALLLVAMFVLAPLHSAGMIEARPFNAASVFLMTIGLLVVSRSVLPVIPVVAATGLIGTVLVMDARGGHVVLSILCEATAWLLVSLAIIGATARAVFASGKVSYHRVVGAILLYLSTGMTFVALYTFIGVLEPASFTGLSVGDHKAMPSDLVYFSFVTLTTVGYGDISPVHPLARSLCNIESIMGMLYPPTLLARVVTLELESRH
jgi:hypothetical protein